MQWSTHLFSFIFFVLSQVSDYGMQQCRSTVVQVLSRPELRLDPPSATVYRGDSVRIRCLSSDIDQSNGYSWTKNNALFQSDAETELWEDLYPDGSILKINNIQVIYIHYKLSVWYLHPHFATSLGIDVARWVMLRIRCSFLPSMRVSVSTKWRCIVSFAFAMTNDKNVRAQKWNPNPPG